MSEEQAGTAVITRIRQDFSLDIPEAFRRKLSAGEAVLVSLDTSGRVVITPIEQIRHALFDTFAMWQDREEQPDDGVAS
jgi:hypothetical protein